MRLPGSQHFRPSAYNRPRGYGPTCDRHSFHTESFCGGYSSISDPYDFYGCPANCVFFEKDRRDTPWKGVGEETSTRPPDSQPTTAESPPSPVAKKAAWIGFWGMVIAALIGAGALLWTGGEKSVKNDSSNIVGSIQGGEGQQQVAQNAPGSTNIQAGRDVVIQSPGPPIIRSPIAQMMLEARFTTTPKSGVKLPPPEVPIMGHFGAHAALEGPPGRVRLDLDNLIRYREQNDGTLVVINRFTLPSSSDLHQRPIDSLANYRTLDVSLNTPDFEGGVTAVRLVEVVLTVNGQDVWHSSITPSVAAFSKGRRFSIPLDQLDARLRERP